MPRARVEIYSIIDNTFFQSLRDDLFQFQSNNAFQYLKVLVVEEA